MDKIWSTITATHFIVPSASEATALRRYTNLIIIIIIIILLLLIIWLFDKFIAIYGDMPRYCML